LLNGAPVAKLSRRPSEYFLDHRRVSSFAYENPKRLAEIAGDVFMFCSDYPHSEGTASPLDDYRRTGCEDQQMPGLFHDNVESLLNR
jgi:predicted TIM-barrel fold metal-dependent hydrolase